jgi:hypothetical protein
MRARAYRILCGGLGGLLILAGLGLVQLFVRFHSAGFRGEQPDLPLPLDAWGVYMAAMAGSACVGWGGSLLAALRGGAAARTIGTFSAVALFLMAFYRILGWSVGQYPDVAQLLRVEAAIFLLLSLAFVWLRPSRTVEAS